jgi:L-2-hydroxyglutarate oxidase
MGRPTVLVVGGGIVGLATGLDLLRSNTCRLVLAEKEARVAAHQSGNNSGVIHSGIYYKPGSLKARFCREGMSLLTAFCDAEGIPWRRCGKLIAAVDPEEFGQLETLFERGRANGVACRMLHRNQARTLQPRLRALRAIQVDDTGIVAYRRVCRRLLERVVDLGGEVRTGFEVRRIEVRGSTITASDGSRSINASYMVNCAGLFADRIARLAGGVPAAHILPFRGEYYRWSKAAQAGLGQRLLYPVPDPRFPFLGVHVTPSMDGEVLLGPNAVLALAREGYRWRSASLRDSGEMLTYAGFWRMAQRHWRFGLAEISRSISRERFAQSARRLVEGVRAEDLEPARAGVRAQAVRPNGQLVDDFLLQETEGALHVINAPSPAATAALRIGRELGSRVRQRL